MSNRVGVYAWAGPSTIRLLETKYWYPQIDQESFLTAYDPLYLRELREKFDVTDAWVTYSWGFSDSTEQEDYEFLRQRLDNFARLGIKTHAYVQGLNLVLDEWSDIDPWCRDPWGRLLPYSKGRAFTCPNNPQAIKIIADRVQRAAQENVDGIYVDNILFGSPPVCVTYDLLPFFGCSCRYCQAEFLQHYQYPLPLAEKEGTQIRDYLQFRATTITKLINRLSTIAHTAGKEFGCNWYDPTLRTDLLYYGYDSKQIEPLVDYILIENHSLPSKKGASNHHLKELLVRTKKPVFVVSYAHDIGTEPQYSQRDIDAIFSEAHSLAYAPCLKVSEFTTDAIWHMLRLRDLHSPRQVLITTTPPVEPVPPVRLPQLIRTLLILTQYLLVTLVALTCTNRWLSALMTYTGLRERVIKQPRRYHLPIDAKR